MSKAGFPALDPISLDAAHEKRMQANEQIASALERDFPVGSYVKWYSNNNHLQSGYVVRHANSAVYVRNTVTTRVVRLNSYRLTARWGGGVA